MGQPDVVEICWRYDGSEAVQRPELNSAEARALLDAGNEAFAGLGDSDQREVHRVVQLSASDLGLAADGAPPP